MQARYYDPVIGRFYSNDPIGFLGTVDTFNRYSYVGNNPYKYTDPTGMTRKERSNNFCGVTGCDYSYSAGDSSKGAQVGAAIGAGVGVIASIACDGATAGVCAVGNPAIVGGATVLGAMAGDRIEKAYKQLAALVKKVDVNGRQEYQYALKAERSGIYPDVRGGSTFLDAGDVWKYGTTATPQGRYASGELRSIGVQMEIQFTGSKSQTLIQEKTKLIIHAVTHGSLPPGNKIFK